MEGERVRMGPFDRMVLYSLSWVRGVVVWVCAIELWLLRGGAVFTGDLSWGWVGYQRVMIFQG